MTGSEFMNPNYGYTEEMNESINDFFTDEMEEEAFKFWLDSNNFRSFGEGLTVILGRAGYTGDQDSVEDKSQYLFKKLKETGSKTGIKTIRSWFEGTRRPKVEHSSRQKIYEICFALSLSIDDVKWLFHHVYFDRCFNFHNIEEAVYYFCLKFKLSYTKAQNLIEEIKTKKNENMEDVEIGVNYTQFIEDQIKNMESEEELVAFLATEKNNFDEWNHSAYQIILELYEKIMGTQESKELVKKLREKARKAIKKDSYNKDRLDMWDTSSFGLLMKELVWDAEYSPTEEKAWEHLNDEMTGEIFSNSFLLKKMWIQPTNSFKKSNISPIVSNNFPSAKVMSNVLDDIKIGRLESYDSIRKVLIMLHFYTFWCSKKIDGDVQHGSQILYEIYKDEAECCLVDAGYEGLYPGNPYDWIFLYCAKQDSPLDVFRGMMGDLMDGSSLEEI